jgi:hypothetical protein
MYTQSPVASDGFILNFINLLLILSKPFTGVFTKYHTFLPKINCFYLMTTDYLGPSAIKRIEKLETNKDKLQVIYDYLD